MSLAEHRGGWLIILSFILAIALNILPLPSAVEIFRPDWVTLTLIYWCLALPTRVGVGIGWLVGLLMDVTRDALLGQHALALAIVAFLTIHLHQRMRVFPIWQQAMSVFILVLLENLIVLWLKGLIGQSPGVWNMVASTPASMLVWPAVFVLLRHLRRTYHVA